MNNFFGNASAAFLETGRILVLGMVGIFAVMLVIFALIALLNKVTK